MSNLEKHLFPEDYDMDLELVTDTVLKGEIAKYLGQEAFTEYIHSFVDAFEEGLDKPELKDVLTNIYTNDDEMRLPIHAPDVPSDVALKNFDLNAEELSYQRYLALYLVSANYYELFAKKPFVKEPLDRAKKDLFANGTQPDPIEVLNDLLIETDRDINAILGRRGQRAITVNSSGAN